MDREKALSQFRLALNGVFTPFTGKVHYGQNVYVPQMMEEIVRLALSLHERLSGNDVPIVIKRNEI